MSSVSYPPIPLYAQARACQSMVTPSDCWFFPWVFVVKGGAGSCLWYFLLLITKFCLDLQPSAVCFDVIFSHVECCYSYFGMAVVYILSTDEHVPVIKLNYAKCLSNRGDDLSHLKYTRNGHEIEHHAPSDHVVFYSLAPDAPDGQ